MLRELAAAREEKDLAAQVSVSPEMYAELQSKADGYFGMFLSLLLSLGGPVTEICPNLCRPLARRAKSLAA